MSKRNNITALNIGDNSFDVISLFAARDAAFAHTLAHVLGGMGQRLVFGF